jgi:RES domain-containing protein
MRFGPDFDQTIGGYCTSHYRMTEVLAPGYVQLGQWNAYVWERIPEENSQMPVTDRTPFETSALKPRKEVP